MHVRIPTADGMYLEADMGPLDLATYNKAMLGPPKPPAANGAARKATATVEEIDEEAGTLTLRRA